ncbi:Fc receptor-like protein 3 isoform B [Alligator mississippiensis]|uniref:Fc receptor-like protein 3 isoform B n=1 Tax=Alligator mississippiensis TaxID=8496 RepID=A0A151MRJ5_ALLMI|nr:Fc receptor-like protein 3 isoform B [Alligator mississippiensis]
MLVPLGRKELALPASMFRLVIFAAHALGLAAVQQAVLTLDPPWSTVFRDKSVTLRCTGSHSPGSTRISWYLEGKFWKSTEMNSLPIKSAAMKDSGKYQCQTSDSSLSDAVQLTVSEDWLILQAPHYAVFEGDRLVLGCCGWKGGKVGEMRYYRDGRDITPGHVQSSYTIDRAKYSFYKSTTTVREPASSPEYQIPEAGLADSGLYFCVVQAVTSSVQKRSPKLDIEVKRVPVSGVTLGVQPRNGQVVAGEGLVLNCSVAAGTGPLAFSWHREGSGLALRTETLRLRRTDYKIPAAMESDAGEYYCAASNSNDPVLSPRVTITVWVPVSPPVLTLSADGFWAAIGDAVEIQCESHRGSAPVVYRFHHEGALLGTRTVSAHGPGSITINLTSESDSGAYSCEADNVPVAGANITTDKLDPVLMVGESLNLSCWVQVGTDPVFRWVHDTQELDVASELGLLSPVGNVLYVESVQLGHAGNYQCIASNQLSPQRVFLAPSEILAITVRADMSAQMAASASVTGMIVALLCLVGAILAAVLYIRYRQKTEETFFTAQWRRSVSPAQQELPAQRLPPPAAVGSLELEPEYDNVCPQKQESGDVLYSVISIKKGNRAKPTGTAERDNGHLVTYAVLPSPMIPRDSATRARASEARDEPMSDVYENVPHP